MIYDIVITKTGGGWGLYYAPYCYGPSEGEYFNADPNGMKVLRAYKACTGVRDDDPIWSTLEEVTGVKFEKVYSRITEHVMEYREEDWKEAL